MIQRDRLVADPTPTPPPPPLSLTSGSVVSMFTSSQWTNSSANGIYGSNMREMDASVGIIRAGLQEAGVENDTIIFFTSDHGPHIELCSEGGNAGPLRGGKAYSSWEGGVRVPGIVTWPGTVSPAVTSTMVSSMDIVATAVDCEHGGAGGLFPGRKCEDKTSN